MIRSAPKSRSSSTPAASPAGSAGDAMGGDRRGVGGSQIAADAAAAGVIDVLDSQTGGVAQLDSDLKVVPAPNAFERGR